VELLVGTDRFDFFGSEFHNMNGFNTTQQFVVVVVAVKATDFTFFKAKVNWNFSIAVR